MRHGSEPRLSRRAECPCLDTGEFFGRQLAARTIGSLHLTDYVYAPGVQTPRHRHSQPYFNLILEGGYTERIGAGVCVPVRSCVLFHPAGESHADRFGAAPTRIFSVEMRPAFLRRSADFMPAIERPLFLKPGPAAEVASRLYREFRRADDASEIGVDALALELLALLLRPGEAEGPGATVRRRGSAASAICCTTGTPSV